MHKVLVISHLYPSAYTPSGYFVYNQLKELNRLADICVIVPYQLPEGKLDFFKLSFYKKQFGVLKYLNLKTKLPTLKYKQGKLLPYFMLPKKYFYTYLGDLSYRQQKKNIYKIVMDYKPDLIYAHVLVPDGIWAFNIKKEFNIPIVTYIHGEDVIGKESNRNFALRNQRNFKFAKKIFNSTNVILVNTTMMKKHLKSHFQLNNVKVNNLGVDVNFYPPREEYKDSFRIVSVSYLNERKAIQYNIMAIDSLIKKGYNIYYDVYGLGVYENRLRKLIISKGLSDRIKLMGYLDNKEVIKTLKNYHLFSLPSWEETFGVVYLEALAAGLPVIGGKGEGCESLNEDSKAIYTVPTKDTKLLANQIENIMINYRDSKLSVLNGQKLIKEYYNWQESARSLNEIFNEVLTK